MLSKIKLTNFVLLENLRNYEEVCRFTMRRATRIIFVSYYSIKIYEINVERKLALVKEIYETYLYYANVKKFRSICRQLTPSVGFK